MGDVRTCMFGFGIEDSDLRESIAAIEWVQLIGSATVDDIGPALKFDIGVVNLEDETAGLENVRQLARRCPDAKIIGIGSSDPHKIITAMREGCAQYVARPVEDKEMRSAFQSARPTTTEERQTICVIGSSSGSGATTVTCNLALELARRAERCAIMDLDLEYGGVACAFDCDPKYTMADICRVGSLDRLDKTVLGEALRELSGVSILSRPHELEQANHIDPACIDKAIGLLGEMFPYVLIDLSRINGDLGRAAMQRADRILIVVQLNVTCVRTAERIYNMAIKAGVDSKKIEIVVNRAQSQSSLAAKKMESFLKAPIISYLPNDYSQVRMSLDMGISESDDTPVRLASRDLAARLAGEQVETVTKPKLRDRIFKLDFRRNSAQTAAPSASATVYMMYGVGATIAVLLLLAAMPWFRRVVSNLVGGADL